MALGWREVLWGHVKNASLDFLQVYVWYLYTYTVSKYSSKPPSLDLFIDSSLASRHDHRM